MKSEPRSWRFSIANPVAWPRRSATRLPVGRVRSSPNHGSQLLEDVVHDPRSARLGQELRAKADQAARRDEVLHARPAGAVVDHLLHPALAEREQLRDDADELLGDVDRDALDGLVPLAVDLAHEHLGLADRQLEAFAPHDLGEHGELELAAALHLPGVRAGVGRTRSETLPTSSWSSRCLTWLAVSLSPSVPARGEVLMPIVIERLGSSTTVTGRGRGSSGSAIVSPIVTSGQAGQRNDLARPCLIRGDPVERFGDQQVDNARVLDLAVRAAPGDLLALLAACRGARAAAPAGRRTGRRRGS